MSFGLVSYASYLPRYRLQHAELRAALGGPSPGSGWRTVAGFDEDSTTMGVEAARRALVGRPRPASLYFATTAPAYVDKTNATAIHAALDLGRRGFAVDMNGSSRSAVGALRTAAASGGLVVLSDVRTGRPGSVDEREGADGAAAFLFAEGEVLVDVAGQASASGEFLDRWRAFGEGFSRCWEERFGLDAYLPLVEDAVDRALEEAGTDRADRVVVSCANARVVKAVARAYPGRAEHRELGIGHAGAADPGVRLAHALDQAAPGESILLVVAADGCDAFVLKITEAIERGRSDRPVAGQLEHGKSLAYATFLSWRGLLEREPPRRPEPERPAAPAAARSARWKFGLVGSVCRCCGRVHAPPRRVCSNCSAAEMEDASLSAREGVVGSCTVDRLAYSLSPPVIDAVVDLDGGGRCALEVTDAAPEEVGIGSRVELTFRRLYTAGGVHNYFWKARPLAVGVAG